MLASEVKNMLASELRTCLLVRLNMLASEVKHAC